MREVLCWEVKAEEDTWAQCLEEEPVVPGARQVGLPNQPLQVVCQRPHQNQIQEQETRDPFSGGEQPGKLWIG